MNKFVIDTYAWIEYFNGTKLGEKVKVIIENSENIIYTNIITIAELSSTYTRNLVNFSKEKEVILNLSKIFNIDFKFAEEAGILHAETKKKNKHIGMADIFILLTAKKVSGKVVTGDEDFRGMKEVLMLK